MLIQQNLQKGEAKREARIEEKRAKRSDESQGQARTVEKSQREEKIGKDKRGYAIFLFYHSHKKKQQNYQYTLPPSLTSKYTVKSINCNTSNKNNATTNTKNETNTSTIHKG